MEYISGNEALLFSDLVRYMKLDGDYRVQEAEAKHDKMTKYHSNLLGPPAIKKILNDDIKGNVTHFLVQKLASIVDPVIVLLADVNSSDKEQDAHMLIDLNACCSTMQEHIGLFVGKIMDVLAIELDAMDAVLEEFRLSLP